MTVTKKIVLTFPKKLVDQPIVYKLIKDHNLVFNILKASITPEEEGLMVIELSGNEKDYDRGINYLKKAGVKIDPLSKDIEWIEEKCTHCGACLAVCPTDALAITDRKTMKIRFDDTQCIACELCIKECPARAMEVHF